MNFSKLDVVDYFDNAKVTCGLIMELEDNRLKLLNDLGKDVKISANRALTCGRDKLFTEKSTRTELLSRLKEINAIRESTTINRAFFSLIACSAALTICNW